MATKLSKFTIQTPQIINSNFSTVAGKNSYNVGPVTVNDGVTVTVTGGTTWMIDGAPPYIAPVVYPVYMSVTISSDTYNFNLYNTLVSMGWTVKNPVIATVTINSGVVVGSTVWSSPGFVTGSSFPSGSSMFLINNGYIVGKGGNGSAAVNGSDAQKNQPQFYGGYAMYIQLTSRIYNGGIIGSGGGGGYAYFWIGWNELYSPGGGGAGYDPGDNAGGAEGYSTGYTSNPGTLLTGGYGYGGGNGGDLGVAGYAELEYSPYVANPAIIGSGYITWCDFSGNTTGSYGDVRGIIANSWTSRTIT